MCIRDSYESIFFLNVKLSCSESAYPFASFSKRKKEARKGLLLVKIKGLSYEEYRSQNNMQHRITVLPFRLHSYSYQK